VTLTACRKRDKSGTAILSVGKIIPKHCLQHSLKPHAIYESENNPLKNSDTKLRRPRSCPVAINCDATHGGTHGARAFVATDNMIVNENSI